MFDCSRRVQEYLAEKERQAAHEARKDRMLVQQLAGYGSAQVKPGVRGGARGKLSRKSTPALSSLSGPSASPAPGDEENEQDDADDVASPTLPEVSVCECFLGLTHVCAALSVAR